MKRARLQYFMADHLGKVAAGVGAAAGIACAVLNAVLEPSAYIQDPLAVTGLLVAMLCAGALGALIGFMVLGRILFLVMSKLSGSPFRAGDTVRILTSAHRDRMTKIYSVWESRGQVRVDMGEAAKKDVTDVLMYYQVCRE